MITVRVPATSANLGAGFDALGLAVNLYNTVSLQESDQLEISSCDGSIVPTGPDNLIYTSIKYLYDLCDQRLDGMKIVQGNNIPMTRGLGSSSACIIGGLYGANQLLGNPFDTDDLVNIAAKIEGHPDNTTPALLGGIVTAVGAADRVYWVKQELDHRLQFVAIVPDFPMSTAEARICLPETIPHQVARHNLSRAALFSASLLQGKYENLKESVDDKLHQPFRLGLISKSQEVINHTYQQQAYATYLSGAGPTLMSIVAEEQDNFVSNMRQFLDQQGLYGWQIHRLSIDNQGAHLVK